MVDYNVNVQPILSQYNNTNQVLTPLIPSDSNNSNSMANTRGYGLYNPAPQYPQSHNYGNALDNIQPVNNPIYSPVYGNLYQTPLGSVEVLGENNINSNISLPGNNLGGVSSDYKFYDGYQTWAQNVIRKTDPYILPFYFSKINIEFIQQKVVEKVESLRGIKINTQQDIDGLLNIMLANYSNPAYGGGIIGGNKFANKPSEDKNTHFSYILAKLNQYTIEQYVKLVLSTLNFTEYYIKDISNLPMPLSQPVPTDIKGLNTLGFVGYFEDNHEFTKQINSFNTRDVIPGKINSTKFGS